MRLYPLQFKPILKEKIWGGTKLNTILQKEFPKSDRPYGESWEISDHHGDSCIITNGEFEGKSLSEVLKNYGAEIVGKKIWDKYKQEFPLLLKFLDINDKLSIQVHPDDAYAIPHHNSFGKAECWYIMDASDDVRLTLGMKEGVSKELFLEKTANNDFKDLFEEVSVKKGDLVVIKPGMVHSTLEGSVFILEIQQNSDLTYRIYDFDRLDNGQKRDLHLEQSAEVIDFEAKADIRSFSDDEQTLLDWEYFTLNRLVVNDSVDLGLNEVMRLYSVIEGTMILKSESQELSLKKGDSILIPANISGILFGKGIIMEVITK